MRLKQLIKDDDAVSPVIGVILMVAITVILAAVIGTFVLGLGDSVQSTSPQSTFSADQDTETMDGVEIKTLTITHDGGDKLDAANLQVTVDGAQAYGNASGNLEVIELFTTGDVTAGTSVTVVASTDQEVDTTTDVYDGDTGAGTIEIDDGSDNQQAADVGLKSDQTVRVVWTSSSGDSSAVLYERTVG